MIPAHPENVLKVPHMWYRWAAQGAQAAAAKTATEALRDASKLKDQANRTASMKGIKRYNIETMPDHLAQVGTSAHG